MRSLFLLPCEKIIVYLSIFLQFFYQCSVCTVLCAMCIQCQSDDCSLVINEINTSSPKMFENQDFIELKMMCSKKRKSDSLQGYKVIGISTGIDKGKQVMTIDLIVNLWNEKVKPDSDFYTIGTVNVPNYDMITDSAYLTYRNKFTANSQSLHSFFQKNSEHLHAIAILYKKGHAFPEQVINAKKPFISINNEIQELIKTNMVDFIVYASKSPYDNCKLFTYLHSDYAKKEYVLREIHNSKGSGKDRTLNRCALDGIPFCPEKFKLGSPTPGNEDDCTGVQFFWTSLLQYRMTKK